MSMFRHFLPFICLTGLVLFSGCMYAGGSGAPAPVATQTDTTPVSVTVPTGTPDTVLVQNRTPVVTGTPAAGIPPDPVNLPEIRFLQYNGPDFSLDHPASWNRSSATYISTICTATQTVLCYQKELGTFGPFNYNEVSGYRKPSRITTFTSADGKRKVAVFVSDFSDNGVGNYEVDPTIEWARTRLTKNYPDVAGSAVTEYQYDRTGSTMTSRYSVMMPRESAAYPLAFTMKTYVTAHHVYEFAFIADTDTLRSYQDLRERIFSSIVVSD